MNLVLMGCGVSAMATVLLLATPQQSPRPADDSLAALPQATFPTPGMATLAGSELEYYLLHGDWRRSRTEYDNVIRYRPAGDGPHAIEWMFTGDRDQTTRYFSQDGEIFIVSESLHMSFTARDRIIFSLAERGFNPNAMLPKCSANYSDVRSYVRTGDCWGTGIVNPKTGAWSQPCDGSTGQCKATITFKDPPGGSKDIVWDCGTGSAAGNDQQCTGAVLCARAGC